MAGNAVSPVESGVPTLGTDAVLASECPTFTSATRPVIRGRRRVPLSPVGVRADGLAGPLEDRLTRQPSGGYRVHHFREENPQLRPRPLLLDRVSHPHFVWRRVRRIPGRNRSRVAVLEHLENLPEIRVLGDLDG